MKKLLLLFSLFTTLTIYSQSTVSGCSVTIDGPTSVCPGETITLTATGIVTQSNQGFDFNNQSIPPGWQTYGGTNYGSPCGPSPDNTPYFWAATASGVPNIQTADFDVCSGGTIEFQMKYAIQGQSSPCEGPDLAREGVTLQYSINSGASWVDIVYYSPNGTELPHNPGTSNSVASGPTAYTSWNNFNVTIPAAAATTNTRFRWIQSYSSGGCCDNWGLDNIFINAGPCLTTNIGWDIGGSNLPSSNTNTVTVTSDTAFVAGLYDDDGNLMCVSDSIYVTVNTPHIEAGADQEVCAGQSITLTATQGSSFVWTPTATNGVAFVPTQSATYSVTGIDDNGCEATDQLEVIVNPLIDYTLTYPKNAYCMSENDPVPTLSSTVDGSYSISPNTVTIDPVTGIIDLSSSTTLSTQNYVVTYSPSNVCYATATFTVKISANPTVNGGNDLEVCEGTMITLTGTGNATTYQWTNGASNGIPFVATTSGQYIVTGTNTYGCENKDTLEIIVNPLPPVVAINDIAICKGDSTTIVATGASSYVWSGGVQNGDLVRPTQTTTYFVTGTDDKGCQKSDSVLVFVHNLPAIDAGPETSICLGQPYTPTGSYGVHYEWSHNATNGQPVSLPLGDNWLYLIGTDANGCTNYDSVLVHVVEPPVTHFTPDPSTGYPGTVVMFTNESENANSFTWDFANGETTITYSPSDNVTSQYQEAGDYNVILYADNGICKYPYTDIIHIIPFPDPTVFVPNVFTPNGDGVNEVFKLDVEWGKEMELVILNRWGNEMATIVDFDHGWDGRTMDGHEATEGTYFYKYFVIGMSGKKVTGTGFLTLTR